MRVHVLGVPDSAAAYCVGVENAPAALRAAGLFEALGAVGVDAVDAGDLTLRRWTPDRTSPYAQNIGEVIASTRELHRAAVPLLATGERILVLGGSCTIALGTAAALREVAGRARFVYVDRHLDLNTPDTTSEGSFSWMGAAHALDADGAVAAVACATGEAPVLHTGELVYLGVDLGETTAGERMRLSELAIPVVPQAALVADPAAAARAARHALPDGAFFVHVDVDVLDFLDAPLAENVNGRNAGPTIAQLGEALATLWAHPDCRGIEIAQLDPAHAASDPGVLQRFVRMLARAIAV
jgi:arginase